MSGWTRPLCALALGFFMYASVSNLIADTKTQAIRNLAQTIIREFTKDLAKEAEAEIASRLEGLAARHGDGALEAARRSGPRGMRLLEEIGENSEVATWLLTKYGESAVETAKRPKALALVSRYGDDAAEALIRHAGIAEPVIEEFGRPGAAAMKGLNAQNGRRLAMMADDRTLAKTARQRDLLRLIEEHGDPAMDFVWKHREAFAEGNVEPPFWSKPEPYTHGALGLSSEPSKPPVQPFASEALGRISWKVGSSLILVLLVAGCCRNRLGRRARDAFAGGPSKARTMSDNP